MTTSPAASETPTQDTPTTEALQEQAIDIEREVSKVIVGYPGR